MFINCSKFKNNKKKKYNKKRKYNQKRKYNKKKYNKNQVKLFNNYHLIIYKFLNKFIKIKTKE